MKYFVIIVTFIFLAFMTVMFFAIGHKPVDGMKNGQIVKIAKEGRFITTYEGALIKGGLNSGSGAFGKEFEFTVNDENILTIVNQAVENGNDVIVHYYSTKWCPLSSHNNGCIFVDKVRFAKEMKK